jgi:S1-C subfamily serine protease
VSVLLLFVLLGCNSVGQGVTDLFGGSTPTPTATPPAAAVAVATPTPSLAVLADPATAGLAELTPLIDAAGLDFAERRNINVYEEVAPSVVNVTTQVLVRNMFGVVPEEGAGSGFILDTDGHILTNYHVVENAQQINISFSDQTVLPAQVVGLDPRNDIAVLKVDAPEGLLRPVELGTSADLKVGQWAIAIGNPFGQFDRTLTTGVISALNRSLEGDNGRTITGVIQTDAAINKGNSGGPLLDSSGRVIGINSAIFSPSGASAGVGFAVPVDTLRRVLPDLLTLGYYRHPWLGLVSGYSLSPSLAQALNLTTDTGILLVQLADNSPLALAGLRGAQQQVIIGNQRALVGGDILVAVDGQPATAAGELDAFLEAGYQVGDSVTVEYLRDGQPYSLSVQLAEEPR